MPAADRSMAKALGSTSNRSSALWSRSVAWAPRPSGLAWTEVQSAKVMEVINMVVGGLIKVDTDKSAVDSKGVCGRSQQHRLQPERDFQQLGRRGAAPWYEDGVVGAFVNVRVSPARHGRN